MKKETVGGMNGSPGSLVADMSSLIPGWILLLLIEPLIATVAGLPLSVAFIFFRRTFWKGFVLRGRIIIGVAMPITALCFGIWLGESSFALLLGIVVAMALIASIEGWRQRRRKTFLMGFPIAVSLVFTVIWAATTSILLSFGVCRYPTEEFIKAVNSAEHAPEWSASAKEQAVRLVYECLDKGVKDEASIERLHRDSVIGMPDLMKAASDQLVFVTLFDKWGWKARGAGWGRDAVEAIIRASSKAAASKASKPNSVLKRERHWENEQISVLVKIDVMGRSRRVARHAALWIFGGLARNVDSSLRKLKPLAELLNLAIEIEPGVDGLVIGREKTTGGGDVFIMLPDEPILGGWLSPRVRSGPLKIKKIVESAIKFDSGGSVDWEKDDLVFKKFRTSSFGVFKPRGEVRDYFRGNVVFEGGPDEKTLAKRISMASDWLARRVTKLGKFEYEQIPPYKYTSDDYNLPRHAGSVFGLLSMYTHSRGNPLLEEAGDRALLPALKALDYMAGSLRSPDPENAPDLYCFMEEKGTAESGSTALGALALTELPPVEIGGNAHVKERVASYPTEKWLNGMGECLLSMIDSEGAVFRNYKQAKKRKKVSSEPLYFPGETALALVRIYNRTKNDSFLEGARRIADRQLMKYSFYMKLDFPWPGDHWIMQALGELAEITGNLEYAELVVLMGKGYLREQYPPQDYLFPDYRGAYRRILDVPRTTRAGSRGEALRGSIIGAKLLGVDTSAFEKALLEGAKHLLEQQFTEENIYFIPANWDVKGAIRMGLVDNHIRIDNNQHGLMALLNAYDTFQTK